MPGSTKSGEPVRLARRPDGTWAFSPGTVERIPRCPEAAPGN